MATGADIPPELFARILDDVCEDAWKLLDLDMDVPNRKEAIKNITACSLVCVHWAHVCRERLFEDVSIKNYKDMRTFSSLVSNTPRRFLPISNHVQTANLEHRIGDRPWIYLLQMQPSLFLFRRDVDVYIKIMSDISPSIHWSPTNPSFICEELTIGNAHFATPHDLVSLTSRLAPSVDLNWSLIFDRITWDPQTRFESDVLTRDPLEIQEEHRFHVSIRHSEHIAEAAWLAFVTPFRHILHRSRKQIWRILPPAQRAILGICALLLRVTELSGLDLSHRSNYDEPEHVFLSKGAVADVKEICGILTSVVEPGAPDRFLSLRFCYIDLVGYSGPILTVKHISVLCIRVYTVPTKTASVPGDPSTRMQDVFTPFTAYPLEEIAQRAALSKLDGRIRLFYQTDDSLPIVATDFETLNELPGDARTEHGYIDH